MLPASAVPARSGSAHPPWPWLFAGTLTACASGPAWSPDDARQLAAMQARVRAVFAQPETGLATNAMVPLPPGRGVGDYDLYLNLLELHDDAGTGAALRQVHHRRLHTQATPAGEHSTVCAAGSRVGGFDTIHDLVANERRGLVLLGARRGEQTVVSAAGTWSGSLWHPAFRPLLSSDGSHFLYVRDGWFADDCVLAPSEAPERGTALSFPGVVQWPAWPGADGSRVRAIVATGGRIEVHDGPDVVATADSHHHAFFDAGRDELHVHLVTAGRERLLLGRRLLPPLDAYGEVRQSHDGVHHAALGRDGERDVLIVDQQQVLAKPKLTRLAFAADGNSWACASQDGEQCFVHRPGGMRSGPLPPVVQLELAADGQQLAICTREGRRETWLLDGQRLGADYTLVSDVLPLPGRAGAVFHGHDGAGWWVVTPAGRDGPWQRLGQHTLVVGGTHYVFLAQRAGEVHRRAMPLR